MLSENFIKKWKNKILNIHPSLLALYPRLDTHKKTLNSGMKVHGASVHIVTK